MTDPTFFMDRSVGLHDVPRVFRDAGHRVVLMRELYPDGLDQTIGDDEWIAEVGARGWVAVTKDAAIARDHSEAVAASGLRIFAFPNANVTGPELAQRAVALMPTIEARCADAGPFVDGLYAHGLETRWPRT